MKFNLREENEEALKSAISGACKKYCYATKASTKTCKDFCYAKAGAKTPFVSGGRDSEVTRESVLESIIRRMVKNELRRKY